MIVFAQDANRAGFGRLCILPITAKPYPTKLG
jgi:hypothetical protein